MHRLTTLQRPANAPTSLILALCLLKYQYLSRQTPARPSSMRFFMCERVCAALAYILLQYLIHVYVCFSFLIFIV